MIQELSGQTLRVFNTSWPQVITHDRDVVRFVGCRLAPRHLVPTAFVRTIGGLERYSKLSGRSVGGHLPYEATSLQICLPIGDVGG
jgi:hypothetical protein